MALDDFEERFATTVKLTLDALRSRGEDESDGADSTKCPSADGIAAYYENTLNRVERSYLEAHFSVCALCQGTLAALLRTAPAVEPVPETAGFAARGRWFAMRPVWRIARMTAATAIVAVAVVAGLHIRRDKRERESTPAPALATAQHRLQKSQTARDDQLALNESRLVAPAAVNTPSADAARAARGDESGAASGTPASKPARSISSAKPAAGATPALTGGEATTLSATTAEPALPSQAVAPPVAPANAEQSGTGAAAAAQAAAALGALAVVAPAPAGNGAASGGTAQAQQAATPPPVTTSSTAPGAVGLESHIAAAATPNSLYQKQQEEIGAPVNSRDLGSANEQAAASAAALSARQRARDQLVKEELALEKRKAALALKAELAKLDLDMKRLMNRTKRDAQAKSARPSSVKTPSVLASARPQPSAPLHEPIAPASTKMLRATAQSHTQAAAAPTPMEMEATPRPAPSLDSPSEIALADRPVESRPAPAPVARGVPVAPHALLLSSADHSVYWSLQSSGVIYRSSDRRSWTPAFTGVQVDLLAGMAPSNTVCWAVGRKGVILLTVDGIHWDRINSPTASDITGISAPSKDVATIYTASGASYSTFDGGSNWEAAN